MFNPGTLPVAIPYLLQATDAGYPSAAVGSQLLAALVVGLLTAFGLQLLLTNLGVAIGIFVLGLRANRQLAADAPADSLTLDSRCDSSDLECDRASATADSNRSDVGSSSSGLSFAAGLGILLTIDSVLFAACFLATTFSQIHSPVRGAIVGIVIWSAYFLILTWISLTTVSSLVNFVLGSAVAGFRQLFALLNAAFSGSKPEALTEAEAIALIQQEMQTALSPAALQPLLENYLETLSPRVDLDAIRDQFAALLTEVDLQPLAATGALHQINRQTFVDLLRQRTALSEPELEQAVDRLEPVWQQAIDRYSQPAANAEWLRLLRSANLEELESANSGLLAKLPPLDFKQIARSLIQQVDWSELEIETVWRQVQRLKAQWSDRSDSAAAEPPDSGFNVIWLDLEDYLLHAPAWQLGSDALEPQVQSICADPEAAPEQVQSQLEPIDRQQIEAALAERQDLTSEQIDAIADRIAAVRSQVLASAKAAEAQEQYHHWRQQLEAYLQSADAAELTTDRLPHRLQALLNEAKISTAAAAAGFNHRPLIADLLQEHTALDAAEIEQVADRLEQLGQQLQPQADALQIQAAITALWQKLASYLRYTSPKQLTPKQVDRKLQLLWNEVQEHLENLPGGLPPLDQHHLKELLHRRKGLSKKQRRRILEQIQHTWSQLQPPLTAEASPAMIDRMANYLINQWPSESEAIASADLDACKAALGDPRLSDWGLRRQLSQLDWDELGDRLRQAGFSQSQLQQQLEWARAIVRQLLKPPRRWATRRPRPADLLSQLKDYLHHTDKALFDPEAIKGTLQYLLRQALPAPADWRKAVAIDRAAVMALLLQRPDLTEAEAASIAEQVESVWSYLVDQAEFAQQQSQSLLDGLLSRLGTALESLSLPPIDVNEMKQSLRQWVDQGFNADADSRLATLPLRELVGSLEATASPAIAVLQDSLQRFSDQTLTALLDSQQLPQRLRAALLERAEELRDRLMQQVEQLQTEALQRVESLKLQAHQRMEATRRAAAAAAWWLLITLSTGALSAAIAGILAARIEFG